MTEKICRTCGYTGPAEDFVKNQSWCKKCRSDYNREYRAIKESTYPPIRVCSKCGYEGPSNKFIRGRSICKACNNSMTMKQRSCVDPNKIRICRICGFEGVASEFIPHENLCKPCHIELNKKKYASNLEANRERSRSTSKIFRAKNLEKERERSKKYRDNNVEKNAERHIRYRKENPDKVREGQRAWYANHKEVACAKSCKWKKENPDAVRVTNSNRRAKKKSRPGTYTQQDIENLFAAQEGRCVYCGCDLSDGYHVDHIIPLVREDSTNWPENLQLLCPSCNCSKGDKDHEEYLDYRRALGLFIYKEAA